MSEGSQKMEGLILELNKSGLSYLVNSTNRKIKTNSQKPLSTSKKQKSPSPKNSRSNPKIRRSTKSQASPSTTSPATTRSTPCPTKEQKTQSRPGLPQKSPRARSLPRRRLGLHSQHSYQHLRHLLLPGKTSVVSRARRIGLDHARKGRPLKPQGGRGRRRKVILEYQDAVALQPSD